jgi:DNA-binding Lrp family transcriptional regulator
LVNTAQQNCAAAAKFLSFGRFRGQSRDRTELRMRGPKLDRIDRRILQLLQANGRMTNIALARRVGISPPPCLRRMRALEAAGLIRGYHADLAPEALGFAVTVFAQIGLASQAERDLTAFENLVASWPEVREAHMLAGETDFLLKIVAPDWDSYQRFLSAKLTAAPNVNQVKSALVLRVSKAAPGVPLGEADDASTPHPVPLSASGASGESEAGPPALSRRRR